MFVYIDFKNHILKGDFDKAKTVLGDVEIDTETFNALSNACMFLSLVFRYPEDEVYDILKDNWEGFRDFIADYSECSPALYDQTEMESDYIRLFEQDKKGDKIVPYISYYTEEKKLLYGKSTMDIREWMAAEGFVLDAEIKELEDHVYIVMEFLSVLFRNLGAPENIEDWYSSLKNLYRVIDNYGAVLTDEFAALVAKRDDMPFYRDFGKVLAEFINDLDPILEDVFSGGE